MLATPYAITTCFLEVQNTNAIPNLPKVRYFAAAVDDLASRFVGGDQGKLDRELTMQNLQVRVAEACCVDFDKNIMFTTLRYWNIA
jgi:hypothetical protein